LSYFCSTSSIFTDAYFIFWECILRELHERLRIFDFDGTLVDSFLPVAKLDTRILSSEIGPIELERMVTELGGSMLEDKILAACQINQVTLTQNNIEKIIARRMQEHEKIYLNGTVQPFEGMHDLLSYIKSPICVASQNAHDRLGAAISATGLMDYFDNQWYFGADQVDEPKPAPDLFLLAAKTMGFSPDQCDVIGDSMDDIRGAVAANMNAYGFLSADHPKYAKMRELLYKVGALKVFSSPFELLSFFESSAE